MRNSVSSKTARIVAIVCFVVAVILFITGFFLPPMGIIDGSVLKAGGILLGFAGIFQIPVVVENKYNVKVTKGDTTVQIGETK